MGSRRKPHLRFLVSNSCDGKCFFCPGSEGPKGDLSIALSQAEIKLLVSMSAETGFSHVVISGGEPLHRNDLCDLVRDIKELNRFETIRLVTRGLQLEGKVAELKEAGLDIITISLDAATPGVFRDVFGAEGLERALESIRECAQAGLSVIINTVVVKRNLGELPQLVHLAQKVGAKLKLIDLMDLKGDPYLWLDQYVPIKKIDKWLTTISVRVDQELPLGGLGTPMKRYTLPDGTQIIARDATRGTWYGAQCYSCKYYPCQDALISLRITADGKLRTCLLRGDHSADVLRPLRQGELEIVRNKLQSAFVSLMSSTFSPCKWSLDSQLQLYQKNVELRGGMACK